MTTTKYPPTKIEVFRPSIGEEEIDAVADVLRSGWLGRGPKVEEFESEWARHIGVDKANVVSVGCATEGLYQVMWDIAGKWSPKVEHREIYIPDNNFIGTASAILESGMTVKLCDIDRQTLNPRNSDFLALQPKPDKTGMKLGYGLWIPAAVIYQHYGGFDSGVNEIYQQHKKWGTLLVEDFACHPMGRPVGDFAVWSFDAMKVLTCGDGGMVYCKDAEAATNIRQATRLGMDTASGQSSGGERWWEFTAHVPGRRSMMNDIGAAIGLVQLRRLPQMVARRQEIWNWYQAELMRLDWLTLPDGGLVHWGGTNSYYTYFIACEGDGVRDRLAHYLRERGVYSSYRYWPISKAYGWDVNCPNSHWASEHVLNLPLHPGLSDDNISFICETIAEFGRTL